MRTDTRHALGLFAIVCAIPASMLGGAAVADQFAGGTHAPKLGRCFPAKQWGPAPDGLRPCVALRRIYEDGSFKFAVSDADGTVRYSGGVGASDR